MVNQRDKMIKIKDLHIGSKAMCWFFDISLVNSYFIKGAQMWDFDLLDFNDFFIMKSHDEDTRDEIKIVHFLQMGEIPSILFLLPHAPSTLANCYRMRSVR